ncbi:MAG: hypothetical protein HY898_19905 [Deltaproteobacteria bacterium]|nr:hypothetical protein [Deltaproteobacteria bacterium]
MRNRASLRAAGWAVAGLALMAAFGSCTADKPTQLIAGFSTQMQVPRELRSVGVVIQSSGRTIFCDNYIVSDGSVRLPSTFGLEAAGDPANPITITVLGFKTDQPDFAGNCVVKIPDVGQDSVLVMRRRRTPYSSGRILYLPMPLRRSCADQPCGTDQSCIGGVCSKLDISPEQLADFRESLVFGNTSTCFPVLECLPAAGSMPAKLIDGDKCLFEAQALPGQSIPDPPGMNVRVTYDNFTPEVLDRDADEGFVIPDPGKPLQFELASSLCQSNYKKGKIVGVQANAACPSKTPLQPICDGDLKSLQAGQDNGTGQEACVKQGALQPTESALLVLMDRSASMKKFFGDTGFNGVLGLSLQDPVFNRCRVGFKFVPAALADCTAAPSPFAALTPPGDVAFDFASQARDAIAAKVGAASNLLASDPVLYLDAAMRLDGVYKALGDLAPTAPSTRFNRKALFLVGNRDFEPHCGGSSPATLAQQALAQSGIYTYVLLLQNPNGADPAALSAASSIAMQGGTSLFDATSDANVGAKAVQTVVSDLSSCLYDKSDLITGTPEDKITLSYFDLQGYHRVDISHNELCTEQSTSQNGWNVDSQQRVRICGSSCTALREAAKAFALQAALVGQPSPGFQVKVSTPCSP